MVEIAYLAGRTKISIRETGAFARRRDGFDARGRRQNLQPARRRIICDHKIDGNEWLDTAREAHKLGVEVELHHALRPHRER